MCLQSVVQWMTAVSAYPRILFKVTQSKIRRLLPNNSKMIFKLVNFLLLNNSSSYLLLYKSPIMIPGLVPGIFMLRSVGSISRKGGINVSQILKRSVFQLQKLQTATSISKYSTYSLSFKTGNLCSSNLSLRAFSTSRYLGISSDHQLKRQAATPKLNDIFTNNAFHPKSSSTTELDSGSSSNHSNGPSINSPKIAYWLFGTSALVIAIVALGGATRLTESGLSITEWKPVTGAIPPLSQADWDVEFAKYQNSPEFKQLHSMMTVDEFKFIFFMEWSHRLLGRAIGLICLVPTAYLIAKKRVSPSVAKRLIGICGLLGLQGAIGWWMVYSGLDQKQLDVRKSIPTVSQYRLTTHLAAAFALYGAMIWTGLDILAENKWFKNPAEALKHFKILEAPSLRPLRKSALGLLVIITITAMSGGFVAGLDAGMIYNEFPKMGEGYIPPKSELFSSYYARKADLSDLWWRNLLDNPTTVQLIHRVLACTATASVFAVHMYSNYHRFIGKTGVVPRFAAKRLGDLMGLVTLQVVLGISALIYTVPVDIGTAHQSCAVLLFTGSLFLVHALRLPGRAIKIMVTKLASTGPNIGKPGHVHIMRKMAEATTENASKIVH